MTDIVYMNDLRGFQRIEAEFPELAEAGLPYSKAWYQKLQELHIQKFPNCDKATRANLQDDIDFAKD